ncbi:MAG: porphobilinogen synthase [Bdellovibrionales bacterium]|nr:porphobilinogen synthase [Bdellovibrionales bacterium]NQZ18066.1 porphobilinogen synthase [Bdellovibrionales bacterium]
MDLIKRPRRNRKNHKTRQWIAETDINRGQMIYPLFVVDGNRQEQKIDALPGQCRYSPELILKKCDEVMDKGVGGVVLFPALEEHIKNSQATEALNPDNLLCRTVREIKKRFPDLPLMTDVALDPYSSDGHDGLVKDGKVLNDETVEILAKMSVLHAHAGADVIAPSDMMDGRILAIRDALDENGFEEVQTLSYAAKYASAFYGPFRSALDSAPRFGDKKTYQLNPRNTGEALLEAELDEDEGADILMVKPALSYLDIITQVKAQTYLPVAAYNVSGEYSMIKAASEKGWIDEKLAIGEMLISIKRAGADMIFTYFALDEYTLP